MNGIEIAISDSVRYLGLQIDSKLKFEKQANMVISKARQRMFIVRRFSALGADSKLVTQLFRGVSLNKCIGRALHQLS